MRLPTSVILAALLLPVVACDGGSDPDDTGLIDDTGAPDDTDDTDTTDTDTDVPVDTSTCTASVEESLDLVLVKGDYENSWGCSTGSTSDSPKVLFLEEGTSRIVDVSVGTSDFSVAVPPGTYDIVMEGCGLIDQQQAGGVFLMERGRTFSADTELDLGLIGEERTLTLKNNGAELTNWGSSELELYPVYGSDVASLAIQRVNDGESRFDHHELGLTEEGVATGFLPEGGYWAVYNNRITGPIDLAGASQTIDFKSVETLVTLNVNAVQTSGNLFIRPAGAPKSLFGWINPDDDNTFELVPGTYDVWATELDSVTDYDSDDYDVLIPSSLGIVHAPGALVVDSSGTATIDITLDRLTGTLTCDGTPYEGDIGFLPDGMPDQTTLWFGNFQGGHHGFQNVYEGELDVLIQSGNKGNLILDDGEAGCVGQMRLRETLSTSMNLALDPLDVTWDVKIDGQAAGEYDFSVYNLTGGSFAPVDDGIIAAGDYLVVANVDGSYAEKKVSITSDGAQSVSLSTKTVPVGMDVYSLLIDPLIDLEARIRPLDAAGDVDDYNRTLELKADAPSVRLADGTYRVDIGRDTETIGFYYPAPTLEGGICLEVGN